LNGKQ